MYLCTYVYVSMYNMYNMYLCICTYVYVSMYNMYLCICM